MKNLFFIIFFCSLFISFGFAQAPLTAETSCFTFPDIVSGKTKLKRGDRSPLVGLVQACTHAKGYNTIPLPGNIPNIDDIFGYRTEIAIKAVQKEAGLPQTGIVDSKTAKILENICCGIDLRDFKFKGNISKYLTYVKPRSLDRELDEFDERFTSIEKNVSMIVDQQKTEIEFLKNKVDSLEYDHMYKKVAIDNRKDRDLIEFLSNNVAALTQQVETLQNSLKKLIPGIDSTSSLSMNTDSVNKSSQITTEIGLAGYAQSRNPPSKSQLYRPIDGNINFALFAKPFNSLNSSGVMRVTVGSIFATELNPTFNSGQVTMGYVSSLKPRDNNFETGIGFFAQNKAKGAVVYASYEGKPFAKRNFKKGIQLLASNSPTIGAKFTARLAKEGWLQLFEWKVMKPIFRDNFSVGVDGFTHREDGAMPNVSFVNSLCHYGGFRIGIHPRTERSMSTYAPRGYISLRTDLAKHFGKYNMLEAGITISNLSHQTRKNIVPENLF